MKNYMRATFIVAVSILAVACSHTGSDNKSMDKEGDISKYKIEEKKFIDLKDTIQNSGIDSVTKKNLETKIEEIKTRAVIQCCKIQNDLRYEFLESGEFEFNVAELENIPYDFSICIEGGTDIERCKNKDIVEIGYKWRYRAQKGQSITIWKIESNITSSFPAKNEENKSSGETLINKFNKPQGWEGNNLEWLDTKSRFKISINVIKL